ncbi:RNA 3'-terminal phosphate cyclase [Candidatus Woesearchaeota archaeon]|nr:RNA 3'-terminal phosphate cyclase [Candidatus Woesearchaeota archaeon]
MIKLDGNYGEGGGQIVRTALALSTITQKPFEVDNIRKGRCNAGLKAQHLNCIKALEKLCNAKAEGAKLASEYLKYYPRKIKGQTLEVDIGTAGSISLLLQSLLIPCFFADKNVRLRIIGGTEGKWAMPYDYLKEILVPQLKRFCDKIDVKLVKRGYYPKGGGIVDIKIIPKYKLADFSNFDEFYKKVKEENKIELIEQGNLMQIKGVSHASLGLQNAKVAERQANSAKNILNKYKCPIDIRAEYADTLSPGTGVTLWAIFSKDKDDINEKNPIRLGADALGERGKPAEKVGKEAASNLIKEIESKASVDSHLADQILPFLALTKDSRIKVSEITNHCRTNIYVIEQFLGKLFEIDEKEKIISIKQ